jgi:hypothetical protein
MADSDQWHPDCASFRKCSLMTTFMPNNSSISIRVANANIAPVDQVDVRSGASEMFADPVY